MKRILKAVAQADAVLIGTGDEFTEKKAKRSRIIAAYDRLAQIVLPKPWFAVTVNTDDLIFESRLNPFFIATPCGSEKAGNTASMEHFDEAPYLAQWQFYKNWLASTLGKRLAILELGVGMSYPSIIRMPFETTALYNQNAVLIRVHSKLAQAMPELEARSVCISADPVETVLSALPEESGA